MLVADHLSGLANAQGLRAEQETEEPVLAPWGIKARFYAAKLLRRLRLPTIVTLCGLVVPFLI